MTIVESLKSVYYLKHKHAKKKSLANEQIINTEQINNPLEETT